MRRYWLIFAQAVTVCLGILFVVTTLRPDLLRLAGPGAAPPVAAASARPTAGSGVGPVSYADGVARAAPSVVNVYTTKHVNVPLVPLPDDRVLPHLFGLVRGMSRRQATTSLGSGVIVSQDGHVLTNYHVVQAAFRKPPDWPMRCYLLIGYSITGARNAAQIQKIQTTP